MAMGILVILLHVIYLYHNLQAEILHFSLCSEARLKCSLGTVPGE